MTTSSSRPATDGHYTGCTSLFYSDNISDYDLLREIGRGNFGRVYEAVDRTTGNKCAVKTIFKKNNPTRIESEVLIHKRSSNHQNIAKLYKAIEDDDNVYLVMELCSGGTLKNLIEAAVQTKKIRFPSPTKYVPGSPCSGYGSLRKSHSSSSLQKSLSPLSRPSSSSIQPSVESILPFPLIRSIFRQVCCGLEFLHRNGVVHRDLNVNNLMLETRISDPDSKRAPSEVQIKIVDFGLALDTNNIQRHDVPHKHRTSKKFSGGTICGTAGFISPEVYYQLGPASPASDVFALGSILYSMVTGTKPPEKVDLSSFPSLLVSLICLLWAEDPNERLPVKDILDHPFILGPICTDRLPVTIPPITARNQEMCINEDHSVSIKFLDKDCSICVTKNSDKILIWTKASSKPKEFTMDSLPSSRWKWFARIHDFLRGIKATTPKIKKFVNPGDNAHHRVSSIDSKGNRLTIIGGILTEASTFKAFVRDDITGQQTKVVMCETLKQNNPVLYGQVKDLYEQCLRLEDTLEALGEKECEDFFPFTSGKNPVKNPIVESRRCDGKENRSQNTLTLSESVTFDDVVRLDMFPPNQQKPDGLQVDWKDGSSMYFFNDGRITYKDSFRKPERVIHATDRLPPDVKRKVTMMPLLYKRASESRQKYPLRESNSLHHQPMRLRPSYSHISC
jgi:serine/threonine protein kinase